MPVRDDDIGNTFSQDAPFRGSALETLQNLFDKDGEGGQRFSCYVSLSDCPDTRNPGLHAPVRTKREIHRHEHVASSLLSINER